MKYEKIIDYCLNKWGVDEDDSRIKYFVDVIKDFNDILPDTIDECVELMLMKFIYYSHERVNEDLINLHDKLMNTYEVDLQKTVFAVLKSQIPKYNSSYLYLSEYKTLNKLSKHSISPEINDIIFEPEWDHCINNLVLVDDICGTGKTLIDFITGIRTKLQNKTVFYLVVHIMAEAKTRIERAAKENGLNVVVIYQNITDAAFTDSELCCYKDQFIKASDDLDIGNMTDILGFRYPPENDSYSEALVAFYEDTPNNTLGIFWKTTTKNKPLFPREDDPKPEWKKMMERHIKRDKSNYSSLSKRYEE